jgi:MFS family permease
MSTATIELERATLAPRTRSTAYEEACTGTNQPSGDEASPRADAVSAIPDGGWSAWSSLIASALFTFWFNGINNSWGVMQAALFKQGLTSTSILSFVGSLNITCCVILSLLSVRFMRLIGARNAGLIGITMLGLGELTSGFTTSNIAGLFGTAGMLYGTGSSLCFMVASVLPPQYFSSSSKLGLANGLIKFAGGIGGTVLSIGLNKSIMDVGTAWTFRIVGICCLATGIPVAFLVKELNPPRGQLPLFDFSLFRNWSFSFIFLAGATGVFALFVPPYFLPLFAQSLGPVFDGWSLYCSGLQLVWGGGEASEWTPVRSYWGGEYISAGIAVECDFYVRNLAGKQYAPNLVDICNHQWHGQWCVFYNAAHSHWKHIWTIKDRSGHGHDSHWLECRVLHGRTCSRVSATGRWWCEGG